LLPAAAAAADLGAIANAVEPEVEPPGNKDTVATVRIATPALADLRPLAVKQAIAAIQVKMAHSESEAMPMVVPMPAAAAAAGTVAVAVRVAGVAAAVAAAHPMPMPTFVRM
jgi:hypothetical protein